MRIHVLVTCHNRRDASVANLGALNDVLADIDSVSAHFFVVDDGSTDGTSEALQVRLPDVTIVRGDGNLFWNRGMCAAFDAARRSPHRPDAYLLVNDDVAFDSAGVATALKEFETLNAGRASALVGATQFEGEITYGGFDVPNRFRPLSVSRVEPKDEPIPCDTINANFALVPAKEFERLGGLDPRFEHNLGDLDLGLRLGRIGVKIFVATAIVGTCSRGPGLAERIERLNTVKQARKLLFGYPNTLGHTGHYLRRHAPAGLWPLYCARLAMVRFARLTGFVWSRKLRTRIGA